MRPTKATRKAPTPAPHNKPPRPKPTTRKIAPLRAKKRWSEDGQPLLGTGRNQYVEAPSGIILSSPHATKSSQMPLLTKQFTTKFHRTRGSLGRDLASHRYSRMTFPNQVITMLYPGNALPSNVNIFKVPLNMNRIQIKNYLEELYGVSVIKVNTAICVGKRRLDANFRYVDLGDWKKAYVRTTADFSFPWPRPITYAPTPKMKQDKIAQAKKEKEEREQEKRERAGV